MAQNNMTAVEWLSDKYNLITWLRNRDEISPEAADEMRKSYLIQAKQMEKEQIFHAFGVGCQVESTRLIGYHDMADQYYNETYGK